MLTDKELICAAHFGYLHLFFLFVAASGRTRRFRPQQTNVIIFYEISLFVKWQIGMSLSVANRDAAFSGKSGCCFQVPARGAVYRR